MVSQRNFLLFLLASNPASNTLCCRTTTWCNRKSYPSITFDLHLRQPRPSIHSFSYFTIEFESPQLLQFFSILFLLLAISVLGDADAVDNFMPVDAQNEDNISPVLFDTPNGSTSRILQDFIFARYVKLSFPGYRAFNLLEVQVFDVDSGANEAFGATASQSSTYMYMEDTPLSASNAVDGITRENGCCEGLAHSNTENDPWWMVDLGVSTAINRVVIWNRLYCCSDRLSNAAVLLLDENNNTVSQVPDIGDASGMTTVELNADEFVLPSEMPSFSSTTYNPTQTPTYFPTWHPTYFPTDFSMLPSSPPSRQSETPSSYTSETLSSSPSTQSSKYPSFQPSGQASSASSSSYGPVRFASTIPTSSTSTSPSFPPSSHGPNGLSSIPPSPSELPSLVPSLSPIQSTTTTSSPSSSPLSSDQPSEYMPSIPPSSLDPNGSSSTPPSPSELPSLVPSLSPIQSATTTSSPSSSLLSSDLPSESMPSIPPSSHGPNGLSSTPPSPSELPSLVPSLSPIQSTTTTSSPSSSPLSSDQPSESQSYQSLIAHIPGRSDKQDH